MIENGIIPIGIVGLTKDGDMFSRVIDQQIIIKVFKDKPNTMIKIVDSLYDSRNHLCKQLEILMDNLCNSCNIPLGRSSQKFKARKQL